MPPEHFDITIPSDTAAGQEVQDRIISAMEARAFPPRDVFGVRLALEEAVVNAIKHGNGFDPAKSVSVVCDIDDNRVCVTVEDEGPGFDPQDVPDPTEDENLDKPSGRGLMLMKAFMTRIEYNPTGNRVLLEKLRGSDDE
jgi:serine/threonine-protein kinase RsbW